MASQDNSSVPKITLHWLEVSRSQRILWLLEELKIPYELKTYKRGADKLADPKLKEVHPLGKSPIITVDCGDGQEPLVLIESANMTEYLCEYYGKWLIPTRYQAGKEGQIGGETESWLRYRTFMHYVEGSLMPLNVIALIMGTIRNSSVPFFIKPITNGVADRVTSLFLRPNFKTHYKFLESQLETSPDSGDYLCGNTLTAADILMSFPLEAGRSRSGLSEEDCPRVWKYVKALQAREAYKRAVQKIEETEGSFKTHL